MAPLNPCDAILRSRTFVAGSPTNPIKRQRLRANFTTDQLELRCHSQFKPGSCPVLWRVPGSFRCRHGWSFGRGVPSRSSAVTAHSIRCLAASSTQGTHLRWPSAPPRECSKGIPEAKFLRKLIQEMSRGELLPKVTSGRVAVSAARSPPDFIATQRLSPWQLGGSVFSPTVCAVQSAFRAPSNSRF
jgi:hypothetical protein